MYTIIYDIKLSETGRPSIYLPYDYENKPEDRFFAIEVAHYTLESLFRSNKYELSESTKDKINTCISLLGQIGDEIAKILWDTMKNSGDLAFLMDTQFHIQIQSFDELEMSTYSNYIIYNSKIFEKKEGLKVLILDENAIFELSNDDNNVLFWKKIS